MDYWQVLEAQQRTYSIPAKRQRSDGRPGAELYQGPVAPTAAPPTPDALPDPLPLPDDEVRTECEGWSASEDEADEKGANKQTAAKTAAPAAAAEPPPSSIVLPDLSRGGWATRNRDKYACQAGGPRTFEDNEKIASMLDALATQYKATDEWRNYAYSKAAKKIRGLSYVIETSEQVAAMRGIGKKTCKKIDEVLQTGRLRRLEIMQNDPRMQARPPRPHDLPSRRRRRRRVCSRDTHTSRVRRALPQVVSELMKVHGVGKATAMEWYTRGIRSIDDALEAGVMNATQKLASRFWRDLDERIPRTEVEEIARAVRSALDSLLVADGYPNHAAKLHSVIEARPCGSYRRGKPSSGDVDVLITRRDGRAWQDVLGKVLRALEANGVEIHHLSMPDASVEGCSQSYNGIIRLPGHALHRRLDLKLYPPQEYAYALLYFTGSDHFNRSMRHFAKAKGYSLSDHGIVRAHKQGSNNVVRGVVNLVKANTEQDIFRALGLLFREPGDRDCDVEPIKKPVAALKE